MFEKQRSQREYAALLDIGSGSVTASIVFSDHTANTVEIVWTHHERHLLKETDPKFGNKPLLTVLLQAILTLGSEGLATLKTYDSRARINRLQISVSAPWSYTITKSVRISKDSPFLISKSLLDDVRATAEEKITADIDENQIARSLELTIVTRSITELLANGYQIDQMQQQEVNSLSLKLSSVIIQDYLHKAIKEARDKVLPKTKLQIFSTILQLYYVIQDLHKEMCEYCIISITLEATEIGVVRDGVLTYSTHESYGIFNLVQEIAQIQNVPLSEVYAKIQQGALLDNQSGKVGEAVTDIFQKYQKKVTALLQQTGDGFTIPKSVYIHATGSTENALKPHIELATQRATGFVHIVHTVADEIQIPSASGTADTTIQDVSGYFFHRYGHDTRFSYL